MPVSKHRGFTDTLNTRPSPNESDPDVLRGSPGSVRRGKIGMRLVVRLLAVMLPRQVVMCQPRHASFSAA